MRPTRPRPRWRRHSRGCARRGAAAPRAAAGHGRAAMSGTLADELATVTPLWAQLRVADRAHYLERAAQAVIDEFDEICVTIAGESRRPAAEIAALELLGAVDALRWLADNARRLM